MFFSQKGLTFHFACSTHEPPFGPGRLLVGSLFLQKHPLIIYIGEIGHKVREQRAEYLIDRVDHRDACEDEKQPGKLLYVLQPAHGEVAPLVGLKILHERKENCAQQKHPAYHLQQSGVNKPESKTTGTDDHHRSAGKEQDALKSIQLFHCSW